MKQWICSLLAIVICYTSAFAQQQPSRVKVLLLGTFHFDNPGLDVAKFENANVLTPKRQAEIQDVVNQLKKLNPDKIFIEQTPSRQPRLDSLLQQYKQGKWQLTANEIYQVGFRLAKERPAATLHAVDYTDARFPFDSLMKVAAAEKQDSLLRYIQNTISTIEADFNQQLKTMTIREMLIRHNSPFYDHAGVGMYFELLKAGGKDNHIGSYITSEWWRRNMVIYENILKRMDGKEKTIIVLFGSSHTALLKEFMKYNPNIELLDVATVLK
jgi:hypothetical protein